MLVLAQHQVVPLVVVVDLSVRKFKKASKFATPTALLLERSVTPCNPVKIMLDASSSPKAHKMAYASKTVPRQTPVLTVELAL